MKKTVQNVILKDQLIDCQLIKNRYFPIQKVKMLVFQYFSNQEVQIRYKIFRRKRN